jgi:hypothetical protein
MMSMNLRSGQCLPKPRVSLIRMIVTLAVLASVSSFSFPAYADLVFPTTTYVYFTRDGEPHDKPVDFTINCYGYWTYDKWRRIVDIPPGTYTPELVFSLPELQTYRLLRLCRRNRGRSLCHQQLRFVSRRFLKMWDTKRWLHEGMRTET